MAARARLEYLLLHYNPPSRSRLTVGVLVWDASSRQLTYRFGTGWTQELSPEDREIALALIDDMAQQVGTGGEQFLRFCEDTLSNILTISERYPYEGFSSAEDAAEELFSRFSTDAQEQARVR